MRTTIVIACLSAVTCALSVTIGSASAADAVPTTGGWEQFAGNWEGKWDAYWPVHFVIKHVSGNKFEWVERHKEKLNHKEFLENKGTAIYNPKTKMLAGEKIQFYWNHDGVHLNVRIQFQRIDRHAILKRRSGKDPVGNDEE